MKKIILLSCLLVGCTNSINKHKTVNIPLYDEFLDVYETNNDNLPYVFETMELLPKEAQVNMLKTLLDTENVSELNKRIIINQINLLTH